MPLWATSQEIPFQIDTVRRGQLAPSFNVFVACPVCFVDMAEARVLELQQMGQVLWAAAPEDLKDMTSRPVETLSGMCTLAHELKRRIVTLQDDLCTPLGEDQEAALLEGKWCKVTEKNVNLA